jgi:hypothetical protein
MLCHVPRSVNRKARGSEKRKTFHFRVLTKSQLHLPFCAKVLGPIPCTERGLGYLHWTENSRSQFGP